MRVHGGLVEQDVAVGIDAAGDQGGGEVAGLPGQRLRVLKLGDGMQVDHAVQALVVALQRHPVAHGAQVVAELRDTGGLDAGEDALHGQVSVGIGRVFPPPAALVNRRRRRPRSTASRSNAPSIWPARP